MNRHRILVAQDAEGFAPIEKALAKFELVKATTFPQAEKLIFQDGISLFVIGVHFEESKCMDLIQLIRKSTSHKTTPIVVVRLLPSIHADLLRSSLGVIKTIQGITDYVEDDGKGDVVKKIKRAVVSGLGERS